MSRSGPASIQAKLLQLARTRGEDVNLLLNRYALERFIYRLSISPFRDRFLLKGALLFDAWFDVPHRRTRDADFLGFGPSDSATLMDTMRQVCTVAADDPMAYDPSSVTAEAIREGQAYGGTRLTIKATTGNARCSVQIDVGFGDAVIPGPEEITMPSLFPEYPPAHLRAYPRAAVVAEKLEAIVRFGMLNSRMKDYFDLYVIAHEARVTTEDVAAAVAATFDRRQTALPRQMPVGLTDEFANDVLKQSQWNAFLTRNGINAPELVQVVRDVGKFLAEPIKIARDQRRS